MVIWHQRHAKGKAMKENDLAKPVADWMRADGYTVYSEIPFYTRCVDMVGLKDNDIRVVELKLHFAATGIRQATVCRLATDDIFLAVGKRPLDRTMEKYSRYGIGYLLVDGSVQVLRQSHPVHKVFAPAAKHLRENCLTIGLSDEAGLPCMSGCGPAQAVLAFARATCKITRKQDGKKSMKTSRITTAAINRWRAR